MAAPTLDYLPESDTRRRARRWVRWAVRLLAILAVVYAAYPLAAETRQMWRFRVAQRQAWQTNVPPVLIKDWQKIQVLDPAHLKLLDGKTVRVANVGEDNCYPPPLRTNLGYQNWVDEALHNGTLQCGIKPVGSNAKGERLVELWALQPQYRITCGNSSHEERRWAQLQVWKNLGDLAVGNGWAQPGGVDSRPVPPAPVRWEDEVSRYIQVPPD